LGPGNDEMETFWGWNFATSELHQLLRYITVLIVLQETTKRTHYTVGLAPNEKWNHLRSRDKREDLPFA
jgi:hypothetical protein